MKSSIRTVAFATLVAAALTACPHRASAASNGYLHIDGIPGEVKTTQTQPPSAKPSLATIVAIALTTLLY
jgi:hypothetical protein